MAVYLLVTLDTKAAEAVLIRDLLLQWGQPVHVVDTGCLGEPVFAGDTTRQEVFEAAGQDWQAVRAAGDRGRAVTVAASGAARVVQVAWENGTLSGVLGLGGSAGTTIATTAMQRLPIGVPKVMVSTMASGQVRPYVADKDICMVNSVVDLAGVNRVSRPILTNAAAAMAGMLAHRPPADHDTRPLIAATMFGVTTPCVARAREVLEAAGYEVLVFHATGNGGQAMESLIRDGLIAGVLDITTTELADELVGGVLSAGPERLTAAAQCGVPQVVSVGATDMVNFGATVPDAFRDRKFYQHNPTVTLMRTTADECRQLGHEIATKVAAARGPAAILLPLRGVSAVDREGQPFDDPAAREALVQAVRSHRDQVEVVEMDCHVNDAEFAEAAAKRLLKMLLPKPA